MRKRMSGDFTPHVRPDQRMYQAIPWLLSATL
jgi:hypothetical protein